MRRRLTLILLIIAALLTSCQSYTTRQALRKIELPPAVTDGPITKYSTIVAEREEKLSDAQEVSAQEQVVNLTGQIETLQDELLRLHEAQAQWPGILLEKENKTSQLTEELIAHQRQIAELEQARDILKAQLAQANAALDEEMRIKAEAQQQRIAAEQQRLEAERRQASLEEEERALQAARLAQERELARQLPPVELLTFPHRFDVGSPTTTIAHGSGLKTLLLPLSDLPWESERIATTVVASISDLDYPVIFLTGAMENVREVVRQMQTNTILLEGGAVITTLAVTDVSPSSILVNLNAEQVVRLSVANLVDYSVFEAFSEDSDRWQEIQKSITPERKERLMAIANAGSIVEPTLLASSLYEPSYQDWNTFSPITYRQTDYLWPLAAAMEDESFYDVYRMTHFSAATDSGNTFVKGDLEERIDYLFARKLVPLTSTILPIGGLSAPKEGDVSRWGIAATFLVP